MDKEMLEQAEKAEQIGITVSRRKAFATAPKLGLGSAALAGGFGTALAANPPEAGSGDTTFTTDQQPYLQGFVPLQQMYLYKLSGGAVAPADTNTSLAYVTKENVEL
jgi:ABC-type sugar transport system substrate-binding protein